MSRIIEYGLPRMAVAAVYVGLGGAALGIGGCGSGNEATASAGVRAACPAGAKLAVLGTEQPDSSKIGYVDLSCMTPLDLGSSQLQPHSNFPLDYKPLEPGDGEQPKAGDLDIQYSYDKQTSANDPFPGQPHIEFVEGDSSVLRVQVDDVTAIQEAKIELK